MAQRRYRTKTRYPSGRTDDAASTALAMKFRAERAQDRRAASLDWQIRFSQMKLNHWPDPDNGRWEPLSALLDRATRARLQIG